MNYNNHEHIVTCYSYSLKNLIYSLRNNDLYIHDILSTHFLKKHRLSSYFLQQNIIYKNIELKQYQLNNQKKNINLFSEIISLKNNLDSNKIFHIFLKGVVLSNQCYGDIGIRECRDIDLLINQKDIKETNNKLISLGYKLFESTKLNSRLYKKYYHHLAYFNTEKRIMIELHWRPFSIPSFFPENDLSKIRKTIIVNNHEISVFENEYNLIYLCIHGSLHMFSELIWILDVAKFISTQSIDWNKFQQIAHQWKIERPVSVGIFLASFICNATIPDEYKQPDKKTEKLINIVLKQLPNEKRNLAYRINKLLYFINLKDGFIHKWNNIKYRFFRAFV